MPLCNGSQTNQPCYLLVADATKCPGTAYDVQIVANTSPTLDGGSYPAGTLLEFTCN
jgi:hypothetical protein